MTRHRIVLALIATGLSARPLTSAFAAAPAKKLVITGTVTAISPVAAAPPSRRDWVVTVRVQRVESGELREPTFSFTVHSPARSGLTVGRRYTIEATSTGQGYAVDDTRLADGAPGGGDPVARFIATSLSFTPVPGLAGLSDAARRRVQSYLGGALMAGAGEAYGATDILSGLPRRRFVQAGVAGGASFVVYEHGGRGHHAHLLVLKDSGEAAEIVHACVGFSPPTELPALKVWLSERRCRKEKGSKERR